jgi:hypothetical protein
MRISLNNVREYFDSRTHVFVDVYSSVAPECHQVPPRCFCNGRLQACKQHSRHHLAEVPHLDRLVRFRPIEEEWPSLSRPGLLSFSQLQQRPKSRAASPASLWKQSVMALLARGSARTQTRATSILANSPSKYVLQSQTMPCSII